MADDEEEDLYDDEFDFVDDDLDDEDDDSEIEEAVEPEVEEVAEIRSPPRGRNQRGDHNQRDDHIDRGADVAERDDIADEPAEPEEDPYATPPPPANYRVHIYEYRQYKRTIDRPFTGEDAESFASEYNRTAKPYGRFAVAGKEDAKPHKSLDDR